MPSTLGKRSAVDDATAYSAQNKQRRVNYDSGIGSSQLSSSAPSSQRDHWSIAEEEGEIIDLTQDVDEGLGWTGVGNIE